METSPPLPVILLLRPARGSWTEYLYRRFRILDPREEEDGVDHASGQPSDAFLARHADSVRAVVTVAGSSVGVRLLRILPHLKCVVTNSMGVDHIDMAECRKRGIAVANAGDVFCVDTADYAVGLLIDVLRRVSAADRYVRSGRWHQEGDFPLGSKLGGKRVGIVGLGKIGLEIAKRLEAFGCIISYHSRTLKTAVPYAFHPSALDLANQSDVLIVACELTDDTRHIINKDVMSALGDRGVVINIGRGGLIDQAELVRRLVRGSIAGAGLDVFVDEPRVPLELLSLDNVVLSPHKAFLSRESFSDVAEIVIGNLEAFFSDRPLLSPVT